MKSVKIQSLIYLIGRGLFGILSFLAISIYTRLLSPEEYGNLTLVTTTVAICNMLFYQWQRVSVLRLLPISIGDHQKILTSTIYFFIVTTLATILLSLPAFYWGNGKGISLVMILVGLVVLWTEALFDLTQEILRADLLPKIYARNSIIKVSLSIIIGSTLIYYKFASLSVLAGLIIANCIVICIFSRKTLFSLLSNFGRVNPKVHKEFIKFGTPFIISFVFTCILNLSDRYFISYYVGKTETGYYAVGYELSRQSIWIVMQAINLAYYPIIIGILEKNGSEDTFLKLKENFLLLIGTALPIAIGVSLLSENITSLFIGPSFANEVYKIMPLSALSAIISGFYGFYFIQAFQLGRKTHLQLWPVGIAALVHLPLNFYLIPNFGVIGALISTIICDLMTLIVSYLISWSIFKMPIPLRKTLLIIIATSVMGVIILLIKPFISYNFQLPILILIGGLSYVGMIIGFGLIDVHVVVKKFHFNGYNKV